MPRERPRNCADVSSSGSSISIGSTAIIPQRSPSLKPSSTCPSQPTSPISPPKNLNQKLKIYNSKTTTVPHIIRAKPPHCGGRCRRRRAEWSSMTRWPTFTFASFTISPHSALYAGERALLATAAAHVSKNESAERHDSFSRARIMVACN